MSNRIMTRKELKEWLKYEKEGYNLDNSYVLRYIAGTEIAQIWHFQRRLRITEYHYNTKHFIRYYINQIILNHIRNKYGLFIEKNVCGKGLRIMHLGHILTNGNVKMGENVALHINTAFVAHGRNSESPELGNNIVVGVGAVVLGGIKIADGIAIGANALVNKSFEEENIAIAGVPAKKISNNGRREWNKDKKDLSDE